MFLNLLHFYITTFSFQWRYRLVEYSCFYLLFLVTILAVIHRSPAEKRCFRKQQVNSYNLQSTDQKSTGRLQQEVSGSILS